MRSFLKKSMVAVMILGLSGAALGKPAHVLFHAGKKAAYPVRHPVKSSRSAWKFLTEVF